MTSRNRNHPVLENPVPLARNQCMGSGSGDGKIDPDGIVDRGFTPGTGQDDLGVAPSLLVAVLVVIVVPDVSDLDFPVAEILAVGSGEDRLELVVTRVVENQVEGGIPIADRLFARQGLQPAVRPVVEDVAVIVALLRVEISLPEDLEPHRAVGHLLTVLAHDYDLQRAFVSLVDTVGKRNETDPERRLGFVDLDLGRGSCVHVHDCRRDLHAVEAGHKSFVEREGDGQLSVLVEDRLPRLDQHPAGAVEPEVETLVTGHVELGGNDRRGPADLPVANRSSGVILRFDQAFEIVLHRLMADDGCILP